MRNKQKIRTERTVVSAEQKIKTFRVVVPTSIYVCTYDSVAAYLPITFLSNS